MATVLVLILLIVLIILIVNAAGSGQTDNSEQNKVSPPSFRIEISYDSPTVRQELRPTGPKADPNKLWIPPGGGVQVAEYQISGGMIYVGQNLLSKSGAIDPALINPSLRVNSSSPDRAGASMTYWPSYSSISPQARAAYLEWLSAGRRTPGAYIGYVFLFFYGLERRLFLDLSDSPSNSTEAESIISEVDELLKIYGQNSSFSSYANEFLSVSRLVYQRNSARLNPDGLTRSWYFPVDLKLALAHFVESNQPLPAAWALAWAELDPQKWFRTPAHRCRVEFKAMFEKRYEAKYGAGIVLKRGRATIKAEYRPASSGFFSSPVLKSTKKPDVTTQTKILQEIHQIAESCIADLDPYSRYIGRKPEERTSMPALALLPREILNDREDESIRSLKDFLSNSIKTTESCSIVPTSELLKLFSLQSKTKLNKSEATSVGDLLEKLDYAIVPDVRYDEGRLDACPQALLAKIASDVKMLPSDHYGLATMIMDLAVTVSAADDNVSPEEEAALESHVVKMLNLNEIERERLNLYMKWSMSAKSYGSALRKKFSHLSVDHRELIAQTMLSIANADGVINPQEIRSLERVYKTLDLNKDRVYSDIHSLQTRDDDQLTSMVIPRNLEKSQVTSSRRVPKKSARLIDEVRVQKTLENTAEVQAVLAQVFSTREDLPDHHVEAKAGLIGLDNSHSDLLRDLLVKQSWSRHEFERLCARHNVLPSGAAETINEHAFERLDHSLINFGDEIVIDPDGAKEIMS